MAKEDIYGKCPDGGAKAAGEQALRRMGTLSETGKKEKCDGPDISDSSDMVDHAKP
jgi:hypothetical protein